MNVSVVWLHVLQREDVRPRPDANSRLRGAKKIRLTRGSINSYQNRLRWTGREDQGAREKHGSGTRQYSGRNLGIWPSRWRRKAPDRLAAKDLMRLFTKNIAPCKSVSLRIGGDAWPVSER